MKIVVIKNNCPQNHKCPAVEMCPANALTQHNFNAPVVNHEQCLQCGKCVKLCPMGALKIV